MPGHVTPESLRRAPQKSHKSGSRAAPTQSPRTRRHSVAHPGTHAKIEAKTSPEQAKHRYRRLSAVPIGGGQGQDRTVDLPLFRRNIASETTIFSQITQPSSPASLLVTRLHGHHSSRADVYRVMPSCSCYRCVDFLLRPDFVLLLCWSRDGWENRFLALGRPGSCRRQPPRRGIECGEFPGKGRRGRRAGACCSFGASSPSPIWRACRCLTAA